MAPRQAHEKQTVHHCRTVRAQDGSDPMIAAPENVALLDAADPLAPMRARFDLPEGLVYLDGNSLGVLPLGVPERVARIVNREWRQGLISSWGGGWIDLPASTGAAIANLIGASPDEVVVGDSTSVNLFKCLAAALRLRPGRRVIVTEEDNFPTDNYIVQGLSELLGDCQIRYFAPGEDPAAALCDDVAVLTLTHVNYRTAAIHDMARITAAAHDAGALTVWDLSHSTGALALDLNAAKVDFAVGCTYKYLNGGPGAPAFCFAARELVDQARQPLSGWMGHADPFAFGPEYEPAQAARRFLCGTPQILSLGALSAALDLWAEVDMTTLRRKSLALTDLFIELVDEFADEHGLDIVTPRAHERRGSHVSIRGENGHAVMRALAEEGVVGDYRAPDLMRFGFTPLYTSFNDTWRAATTLRKVLDSGVWRAERFAQRQRVT